MRSSLRMALCLVACGGTSFANVTLYMGSAGNRLLGVVTTTGATAGTVTVINTSYPVSGVAGAGSFLFTEDTNSQTINKINAAGAVTSSLTGNFLAGGCCGESLFYDGTFLWRVKYSTEIEKLDPTTGNVISTYAQSDKVGITSVNGTLWLSDWITGDVGPWNPTTNTFTPAFNTSGSHASPGGLAFDSGSNILWIGNGSSNSVVPYSLTGTPLNAGFVPFDADEIDGLTVFSSTAPPPTTPAPPALLLGLLGVAALGIFTAVGMRRVNA